MGFLVPECTCAAVLGTETFFYIVASLVLNHPRLYQIILWCQKEVILIVILICA